MKKKYTKKDVEFALDYLNYGIHEGMIDDIDVFDMTDREIVEMATDLMDKGDQAYDAWKERFI